MSPQLQNIPSTPQDGETVALRDGGWIRYWKNFLAAPEAERLFETLRRDVPWQQFRNGLWIFPRLTAFVADAGVVYRYSGVKHAGAGWTSTLLDVRRRVEQVSGTTFNGVLLNLYRDGSDSMGRHADAEAVLGPNPLVASVSLGAARTFLLRHTATKEKRALELTHGSLLLMGGTPATSLDARGAQGESARGRTDQSHVPSLRRVTLKATSGAHPHESMYLR